MILTINMQVKLPVSTQLELEVKKEPSRQLFSNLAAPSMSSSTSSEASTSNIVTEEESTVSGPFEGDTVELTGIPLDRFLAHSLHRYFSAIFVWIFQQRQLY